jgi:uncharacterized protein (TIGR02996 family)
MSKVDEVLEQASSGHTGQALALAVQAWRTQRAGVIADAVVALGERLPAEEAPRIRTNKAFQARWIEVASADDARAVGWLAASLTTRMPKNEPDDLFNARLEAIRKRPDPRFSTPLLAMIRERHDIARWCRTAIDETLRVLGDERMREALTRLEAENDDMAWADVFASMPSVASLDATDVSKWQRILGATSGKKRVSRTDMKALFEAVYTSPDSDAPRHILADALQETGDPRGEFIALQLAEAASPATAGSVARADELLATHHKTWLGPLHSVVYRARFRRGFLDLLELEPRRKASAKMWEIHARDPQLMTVRTLLRGRAPVKLEHSFILSPALISLRQVAVRTHAIATALAERLPERLEVLHVHDEKALREWMLPLVATLPGLREVGCPSELLGALKEAKGFDRLTGLEVFDDENRELLLDLPPRVNTLALGLDIGETPDLDFISALPTSIETLRIDTDTVLKREGGEVRGLALDVSSAGALDRSRHPYGLPQLIPKAKKLQTLSQVDIALHEDMGTEVLEMGWPEHTEVRIRRVYQSGLTRPYRP